MKRTIIILLAAIAGISQANALDLSLNDCRRMALETDENIRIAENNVAEARLDKEIAHTAYLPNFSGSANVLYQAPDTKMGDMMTMQLRGAYMAGISLTQPIYTGGKITAANKMAAVGKKINEEQLRAAKMDVIADAEKSYWTYVAVLAKVDMMESYLAMIDSIYNISEISVKAGMAPKQSLLRVDTRRSEIIYRLKQTRAGADICRLALCRAIGASDTTKINPTEQIPLEEVKFSGCGSVMNRPEVAMLAHNIDIKKHDITMVRADFLPTVGMQLGWSAYGNIKVKSFGQDATGNYVPMTMTSNSNGFMGILSVQIPIFHWGEGKKKVRKAKLELENARLTLERNKRLMQLEANQNYNNLLTGEELIVSAQKAMNEADENLRVMKRQFEVGYSTLTDLLDAQSQWHTSYSNLIEARTQYRIYYVDYLRSIGDLK